MEFWSRLIGGGGKSPTKQSHPNSPQQRLARFKSAYEPLALLWRKSNGGPLLPASVRDARNCLETLRKVLQDESRASAPHICIESATSSHVYVLIIQLVPLLDAHALREALKILSVLIDNDEGSLIESRRFANAIGDLCYTLLRPANLTLDSEVLVIEVLFEITAKLRLKSDSIQYWFTTETLHGHNRSNEEKFPLFHALLNHVHHEGRIGEFARTGLLYVIGTAADSESLEKWIIESDLAALMASGLGALYSQMSRNIAFSYAKDFVPPVIAFSESLRPEVAPDVNLTASAEFQSSLAAFLAYLVFWQDMLEHCASSDVRQTLLEHFEFLFLQQLLYPSLLESSDVDGGAVAVLTYLKCILESINNPELVSRILRYLLALPKKVVELPDKARPNALARRRKSELLIVQQAKSDGDHSPSLFNLADLLRTSLQSRNQQTLTATLRLLSSLLDSHHPMKRSFGSHEWNIDGLLDRADHLIYDDTLESCYESHVQDARVAVESHVCSEDLLTIPSVRLAFEGPQREETSQTRRGKVHPHYLQSDDPLLLSLFALIETFLTNDIETNLSLTQVISALASCGHTRLEGWLLGEQSGPPDGSLQQSRIIDPQDEQQLHKEAKPGPTVGEIEGSGNLGTQARPAEINEHVPPMVKRLDCLIEQVDRFSREIEDFDVYLAERKHVFNVGEEIENALNDGPLRTKGSEGSKATSKTRKPDPPHIISISERLLSAGNSSNVSRSASPRGRQRDQSGPTLVGRLNHLRISPSPNPSKSASSAYGGSPHRRDSPTSTSSPGLRSPISAGNALRQTITIPTHPKATQAPPLNFGSSETSSVMSGSVGGNDDRSQKTTAEVSLSHLLTNVVILQEFLLELAAIIEVRASLFGEVSLE